MATLSNMQVSEIDLVYRNKVRARDRLTVSSSSLAYEALMAVWDLNKIDLVEQSKLMLLDASLKCLGVVDLSAGGITAVHIDPRIVFAAALKARATAIILAHNHPSQNTKPSESDIRMTKRFAEIGQLHDITLEDHLIVTTDGYYSMRENGVIPT
ncbi:MAG TPA: JAB domain-containing protein [Candidatus Babeliaceae bacterium]|nr:JAB domain-containing protein [Candidatus Babeliaceae bacterium]